jgi:hypothetical protein
MKKAFAVICGLVLIASTLAFASTGTYTGYVVDEKCGAKGAHAGAESCAKKCIEGGMPAVLVTDSDKKVYQVENQDAVTKFAGKHVTVTASLSGDKLHIEDVKEAPETK